MNPANINPACDTVISAKLQYSYSSTQGTLVKRVDTSDYYCISR